MPLTSRDRKRALTLLMDPLCRETGPEPDVRAELQAMLMLNLKAEIQCVETSDRDLGQWVETSLGGMGLFPGRGGGST